MGRQPSVRRTSTEEEEGEDRDCEGREHAHGAGQNRSDCLLCSVWGQSGQTEETETLLSPRKMFATGSPDEGDTMVQ